MMGAILTAIAAAGGLALSAAGAAADCVEDWRDKPIETTGTIDDLGEADGIWWIAAEFVLEGDCLVHEIWNYGTLPAGCRFGGSFKVSGRFEYEPDDVDHAELFASDVLAIRAERIDCN